MRIFLDDIRDPPAGDWVVCRSYDEFVATIERDGFPEFVSFDHDLGDKVPSGKDAANWLVERDLDTNSMPTAFGFYVHSANPPGAENIQNLLSRYLQFRKNEVTLAYQQKQLVGRGELQR